MTPVQCRQLQNVLGLSSPPVALAYRTEPPPGVPRVTAPMPAGCGYWKAAAEGRTFYTEASDHFGCPVGAYTNGVSMTDEKTRELGSMVETMVSLEYLRRDEVPQIPRRTEPFAFLVYAPLADAPFEPDLVLIRGNARQIMLLTEAARAGGVPSGQTLGRPACSMIPAAMAGQETVASFGCIGNRVYTELPDDEMYMAIPRAHLSTVVERLTAIVAANSALEQFHLQRRAAVV